MTKNRRRVLNLMKEDPHCYWCGVKVIIDYPAPKTLPLNWATLDHLYSVKDKTRRDIAMTVAKLIGGAYIYYVLSCSYCNTKKGSLRPSQYKEKLKMSRFMMIMRTY